MKAKDICERKKESKIEKVKKLVYGNYLYKYKIFSINIHIPFSPLPIGLRTSFEEGSIGMVLIQVQTIMVIVNFVI